MAKSIVTVGLLLVLGGCGSSEKSNGGTGGTSGAAGNGGASSCAAATGIDGTSVGTFGWRDNGALQCATLVLAGRQTATVADTIEIDAATESTGIDIALSSYNGPLGGTYGCQTGNGTTEPNVLLEVTGLETGGIAAASTCMITIGFSTDSSGAQHAQGTFSTTVTGDGGSDAITDGTFDLTVMLQGG